MIFIRIGFPAITPKQFYESASVVDNIAALLGVSPSKIRRVKIVRETDRRRRAVSESISISFVIENDPASSIENVSSQLSEAQQVLNQIYSYKIRW